MSKQLVNIVNSIIKMQFFKRGEIEVRAKVREYLQLTGIKQKWICQQIDCDPSVFSRWLKGERDLTYTQKIKLKIIIGVE